MTHAERPWREVWGDRGDDDICDEEISENLMAAYFREIYQEQRPSDRPDLEELHRAVADFREGRGIPLDKAFAHLANAISD